MERRSEPRFDAQKTVIVTLLEENGAQLPALAVEVSGNGMRLILNRPVPIGAAVKVEPDDAMVLGEVCYCQPRSGGFLIGLKLNQVLSNLDQLAKLNRRLLGEEPREKPTPQPAATDTQSTEPGRPVSAPGREVSAPGREVNAPGREVNAWIGGRSRR